MEVINTSNLYSIDMDLKSSFMELYNNKVLSIDKCKPNTKLGENIYELPGNFEEVDEFGAIVTVVNQPTNGNYYDSWNLNSMKSNFFCTSYIEREMCGTVLNDGLFNTFDNKSISFGFCNLKNDSLVMMGKEDLLSRQNGILYESQYENHFYDPSNLINRKGQLKSYDEMCFKRMINGQKVQPDYIVIYRLDGVEISLEEAKKAQEDFEATTNKKLPILIIDLDKCLVSEQNQIKKLVEEYRITPSKETYLKIQNKLINIIHSEVYSKEKLNQKLYFLLEEFNQLPKPLDYDEYDNEDEKNYDLILSEMLGKKVKA